jgi:xanthine dehydrogenase accessory factor
VDVAVLAEAVALAGAREPFTLATVVWRRGPSSSHVGSKAIVHADGTIDGWLGGACAEPSVVREALAALGDGKPRLLLLGDASELVGPPGAVTVPMACESEGAIEVYLEPVVPRPHVVVVGRSPAVFMLATLAVDLGWDVAVVDRDGRATDHPHPALVRTTLDLAALGVRSGSAVVVATQGHYDDLALDAALATPAGYVGLVASAKRAASTLELLADRGVSSEQLQRVVAPAGLDLGPVENAEIGVAVLAELVARRASGQFGAAPPPPARVQAVDPVCGMVVDPATTPYHSRVGDRGVHFCAAGCKAVFDKDPNAYPVS